VAGSRCTAREIDRLEHVVRGVAAKVADTIPARFILDGDGNELKPDEIEDEIGRWWHALHLSIQDALQAVEILAEHYRATAGAWEEDLAESGPPDAPKSSSNGRPRGKDMPAPATSCTA